MKAIQDWFDAGCDYNTGVIIYNSLPIAKTKITRSLKRGKTNYTQALIIKELRQFKNKPLKKATKKRQPTPKPKQPVTDAIIATEHKQESIKQENFKVNYGTIKYAELPPALKLRWRKLRDLFYDMCDLKFALNQVPAENQSQALAIILQIDALADERTLIWKELDHYQNHKTELPTETEDFSKLNSDELRTKKFNFKSNKSRLEKRTNANYDKLMSLTDATEIHSIERKISKAEKAIHQYELHINALNKLL